MLPEATAAGPPEDPERLARKLSGTMLRTVAAHRLIEEGDRILVAISGGKDSYTLLELLCRARRKAPVAFELIAFHLDQGQPGYDGRPLRRWLEEFGATFEIVREDTYKVVMDNGDPDEETTSCRLCSRLRRCILYTAA